MTSLTMILLLAAFFLAAILNLAVDSSFRKRLTGFALVFAALAGSVFYGYGYAQTQGFSLISLMRAMLALCRMFVGVNDLGSIQAAPLLQYPAAIALFWLAHFLAYYVMASAAIATVGQRALRSLRVTLLRRGPLLLIYGIHDKSVAFGRRQAKTNHCAVIFVDPEYNAVFESAIDAFGGVVEKTPSALAGDVRFLKHLNMKAGKRRMNVAVLQPDGHANIRYARALKESTAAIGLRAEQVTLIASGIGDEAARLQALGGEGFGSVYAFDAYEVTARQAVQEHPPCDLITFDEKGKAQEDFCAVILGFGRTGRAVLNQLVMNGQFHGSEFRADIFDPSAQNGYLHHQPLMQQFDIRFHAEDGNAEAFYDFLEKRLKETRLIVLCTGSQEQNQQIASDLQTWFPWGEKTPPILLITREEGRWIDENGEESDIGETDGMPDPITMDAMAMQVNQVYCEEAGSRESAAENWRVCDYFNRQSSRACADFYPAMLRMAGVTESEALAGKWPPEGEMLENLSRTEHLRWSAFQAVIGYAPMPEEVWNQRAEQYRQGAEKGFRISRDSRKRLQACLIPWEELPALSERENAVTGKQVDYQQMDRNNVLMLARVIREARGTKE